MQRARQTELLFLKFCRGEGGGCGERDTARGSFTMIQEVLGMACLKSYITCKSYGADIRKNIEFRKLQIPF